MRLRLWKVYIDPLGKQTLVVTLLERGFLQQTARLSFDFQDNISSSSYLFSKYHEGSKLNTETMCVL